MARANADFDQFVVANVDDLLRTAYLIAWDQAEAEDLVQECLFKVARRWPRVRLMDQPRAYARRILINLATDGARRRAPRAVERRPPTPRAPPSCRPIRSRPSTPTSSWSRHSGCFRPVSAPRSSFAISTT